MLSWSVYQITLLLDRLSPLSTSIYAHSFARNWQLCQGFKSDDQSVNLLYVEEEKKQKKKQNFCLDIFISNSSGYLQ